MSSNVDIEARYKKESRRITKLLKNSGVSEEKIKMLSPVVENTAWMKVKLDDSRDAVKTSQVVISYDNGGGQKGIRENPIFKGYESLWKSYMQGMKQILDVMPDEFNSVRKEEIEKPISMLEVVRARKKAQ